MENSLYSSIAGQQLIDLIPQKPPFLFIDRITDISEHHIVAQRLFRHDEFYYQGHFPSDPITPGVILLEAMAQVSLVALGTYLLRLEDRAGSVRTLFTECRVEFFEIVRPGDTIVVRGQRKSWRLNKLVSQVQVELPNGVVVASGMVAGMGVVND